MKTTNSPLHKLHHLRSDLRGALHLGHVAAAGENCKFRLRHKLVDARALGERRNAVLGAPHQQHRHFELRQQIVGGVPAGEHGIDGAMNDPGVPVRIAYNVARDEARNFLRMGHQQRHQLVDLGGRLGRKEPRIPVRFLVEADRVEEHQPAPISAQGYKPVALPPNTYSNAPLYPQASAFNVLLLDGLHTPVDKQTDVRRQMIQYMGKIAPGTSLAIFTLSSRLRMITGFTTDASQLTKAMQSAKTTPRTSDVTGSGLSVANTDTTLDNWSGTSATSDSEAMLEQWEADITSFQTDERVRMTLDAFQQLALYLGAVPGRKNIIWFSASFPIGIDPDTTMKNGFDAARMYADQIRQTSEDLAAARVSGYPVDARGLMNFSTIDASYTPSGGISSGGSGGFGRGGRAPGMGTPMAKDTHNAMVTNAEEEASMREIAKETGGKAYINTNGLRDAIADAVANGSSYYTLTYVPENKNFDGRFRKLQVRVDGGGLNLAYRDGYYADPASKITAHDAKQITPILAAMLHGAPPATQILFNTRVLLEALHEDSQDPNSSHDFGRDVIPRQLPKRRVVAYDFRDINDKKARYWRDVGTLDAYYEANMDLVDVVPEFNLYDYRWPIRTKVSQHPPAKFVFAQEGRRMGLAVDSIVSAGVIVSGGRVLHSVLSPGVRVNSYCEVEYSILMPGVEIGRYSRVRRAIVNTGVKLPESSAIGFDPVADRAKGYHVTEAGITVVA